tara:strand:+ start:1054 stop:1773 length:720 start_codon:yes stop_codon:yes gene_type:complete
VRNIKCVIAAGGLGTRLKDYRDSPTKMLLEVKGITMINRQINQLQNWGLEQFIIITNPDFDTMTKNVTNKEFPNLNINYAVQETPKGISHALLQAERYLSEDDIIIYILGDNFLQHNPLSGIELDKNSFNSGCYIFSYQVDNPEDFGVAELDEHGKVISIEEKPELPKSNNAIIGVYVFDSTVINKIKTLKPSPRGEYEITDLCDLYIKENTCMNIPLKGWWIDAGTPERIEELESKLI